MARLQILELPQGPGDDRPPFILVIDEVADDETERLYDSQEAIDGIAKKAGARAVAVFHGMTVNIPANEPPTPGGKPTLVQAALQHSAKPYRYDGKVPDAQASEIIEQLKTDLDEARQWARHGYEIGQKHCGWTDYGVAPAWLTEGWPRAFDSCEHLKRAAEYDEALTRVRNLPERPDVLAANPEQPYATWDGYAQGIRAAKQAASIEPPYPAEDGG